MKVTTGTSRGEDKGSAPSAVRQMPDKCPKKELAFLSLWKERRDSASGKMHRKWRKSVGEKVIISEACTFLEDA